MPDMLDAHTRHLSAGEKMQWRTDFGGETNEHKLVITLNYYAPEMFTDGRPASKHPHERFPGTPVQVRDASLHKARFSTEGPKNWS